MEWRYFNRDDQNKPQREIKQRMGIFSRHFGPIAPLSLTGAYNTVYAFRYAHQNCVATLRNSAYTDTVIRNAPQDIKLLKKDTK